jgi:hypothetical protein
MEWKCDEENQNGAENVEQSEVILGHRYFKIQTDILSKIGWKIENGHFHNN